MSSTKYDPDLLRADVAHARNRVSRLKRELDQVSLEVQYKQHGVDRLARYGRDFSSVLEMFVFASALRRKCVEQGGFIAVLDVAHDQIVDGV